MAKTFYSVKYTGIGFFGARTKWFADRSEAYAFADQDYHDKPVAHTYRNTKSIAEIEQIIRDQAASAVWYS